MSSGEESNWSISRPDTDGNENGPCAACKVLRRKCLKECVFAPHFPANDVEKFMTVHKVFGASNLSKILQDISPHERGQAVNSLVCEAEYRIREPVHGCVGVVAILQHYIRKVQQEIEAGKRALATYVGMSHSRPMQQQQNMGPSVHGMMPHDVQRMVLHPVRAPQGGGQLVIRDPQQQQQEDQLLRQRILDMQQQVQLLQQQIQDVQQVAARAAATKQELLRAREKGRDQQQQELLQQQQRQLLQLRQKQKQTDLMMFTNRFDDAGGTQQLQQQQQLLQQLQQQQQHLLLQQQLESGLVMFTNGFDDAGRNQQHELLQQQQQQLVLQQQQQEQLSQQQQQQQQQEELLQQQLVQQQQQKQKQSDFKMFTNGFGDAGGTQQHELHEQLQQQLQQQQKQSDLLIFTDEPDDVGVSITSLYQIPAAADAAVQTSLTFGDAYEIHPYQEIQQHAHTQHPEQFQLQEHQQDIFAIDHHLDQMLQQIAEEQALDSQQHEQVDDNLDDWSFDPTL